MAHGQGFPIDSQKRVDHFLRLAGSPGFPDVVLDPFGGGYNECAEAVGFQLAAKRSPGAFVSGECKGVFGPAQVVVREHGDPDVRTTSIGELVVKGMQAEIAFHAAEGVFHPDEGDMELPELLVFEFDGAAQVVASVQLAAVVPCGFLALPAKGLGFGVVVDFIETGGSGNPGIAPQRVAKPNPEPPPFAVCFNTFAASRLCESSCREHFFMARKLG